MIPRLIAVIVITLLAAPAGADTSKKAAAEALFQAGRALVEEGQIDKACEKLEASQELDPAIGTLLHLGDCYERMQRTASAWAAFREAASLAQIEGQTQRELIAKTRADALEGKLSRVELRVSDAPPGLELAIAELPVPRASWGVAIPVDPGWQELRATAPGRKSWSHRLEIPAEGGHEVVHVPALAKEAPPPQPPAKRLATRPVSSPTPDRSESAWGAQRTAAVIVGAVGLAGLSAGSILGLQALLSNEASLSHCQPNDPSRCTPEGVREREQAKDFALGSTIAFAAGGALVATGITLFALAPDESVTLSLGPTYAGVGGRF